jgi:hypothetical protein
MNIRVLPTAVVLCLFANRADLSAQPAKALVIKQGVPYSYNGRSMTPIGYAGSKQVPTPKPKVSSSNALVIKQGTPYLNGKAMNSAPTMKSAGAGYVKRSAPQNSPGAKTPDSHTNTGATAYSGNGISGSSSTVRK